MSLRSRIDYPKYHQLLAKRNAKSSIWQFYGLPGDENGKIINRGISICKLCKSAISSKGATTSNLRSHVKFRHPAQYRSLQSRSGRQETNEQHDSASDEDTQNAESQPDNYMTMLSEPSTSSHVGQPLKTTSQRSLMDYAPLDGETSNKITESIAKFIAVGMQSYHVVENAAFQEMIKTLNPSYCMPGRKYFSQTAVPQIYLEAVEKLKLILPKSNSSEADISVTCDCWTSIAGHPYVTVTVHFIKNWELISACLSCQVFQNDHDAKNLKEYLENKLMEWDINPSSIICCTTDNGQNIVNAVDLLQIDHLPCFPHSINIGVNNALKVEQVRRAVGQLKALQNSVAHNWKMKRDLKEAQVLLKCEPKCLTSACPTRWWSTLKLCKRFLDNQLPICKMLLNYPDKKCLMPEGTDVTTLEAFSGVASVLQDFAENLSGDNYVTSSAILPLLYEIKKKLKPDSIDSNLVKILKQKMLGSLDQYEEEPVLTLLQFSTFIDPRFKLNFFNESDKKDVLENVINKIAQLQDSCNVQVHFRSGVTSPPKKKRRGLAALLEGEENIFVTQNPREKAEKEVHQYITMSKIGLDEDPLNWWKNYEINFPKLSKLARKYLSIQGSSVPSERVFSTGGIIANKKRCSLLLKNVEMQIFLSYNKKLLGL